MGIKIFVKEITEHYKKHSFGYSIGAIGLVVNILYFIYLYVGPAFFDDIVKVEPLIILLTMPAFMVAGYLSDRRIYLIQELEGRADQLERSSRFKDLYIDILTHDLTNPVSVIKGMAEIGLKEDSIKDIQEGLHEIRMNAIRLGEMIGNASNFAKLESVKESDYTVKDLAGVISNSIESTQNLADAKGVKIENNVKGEYPILASSFIGNVFSNLLSNAVKYGPEKSLVIVDIDEVDGEWEVKVKDRGDGIPDEYKKGIFDRFKRRMKEGVKGSGLGLAIVKRIVKHHNGKVWVEDNPEGGSIFYVRIPKAK